MKIARRHPRRTRSHFHAATSRARQVGQPPGLLGAAVGVRVDGADRPEAGGACHSAPAEPKSSLAESGGMATTRSHRTAPGRPRAPAAAVVAGGTLDEARVTQNPG